MSVTSSAAKVPSSTTLIRAQAARSNGLKDHLSKLRPLYRQPLTSTRTGPLFNAFPYPTKISPEAIAVFLATHTRPGDLVLDTFAGSGSAGIAALLCDAPTPAMIEMAKTFDVTPTWGPRNAVLYELGVMGSFAASTMCGQIDPDEFESAALQMVADARSEFDGLYSAESPAGIPGEIRYVIWSEVLICKRCGAESSYWDALARRRPARMMETFSCPACKKKNSAKACERVTEEVFDPRLNQNIQRRKRVLAWVYGKSGSENWERAPTASDIESAARAETVSWPASAPLYKLRWGDLYRAGYHQGISHLHHFYTSRNFLAIASMMARAEAYSPGVRDALKLLILSYNSAHSTLMTRIAAKKNQPDFSVTSAQSGVMYVSALPVEKNVFEGVLRKIKAFKDSFTLTNKSKSSVRVVNSTSTQLQLESNTIDYVFTDPPFGDYIPYSEINQINEAWLGRTTDPAQEVIVSNAQGKSVATYGDMMGQVFVEIARTLKPDAAATIVFHSANAKIWQSLSSALEAANLQVKATSVLDKAQPSFKQATAEDSVKGDALLLVAKGIQKRRRLKSKSIQAMIDEVISQAVHLDESEREPHRLYSRFVSKCLEMGIDVSVGAKEFYGVARASSLCSI